MLELERVSYTYPRARRRGKPFSLRDVSFRVDPGRVFTLLGPNGAGKTTIIRILSGLILPTSGAVRIAGHDARREERWSRRALGLVLGEERTFYYRLSGRQNLEFFGGLYGLGRRTLRGRIAAALELVGLEDFGERQYMRYSTGMKKRLGLARALLHEPEVFLLDEPNSGVDPESASRIRGIIDELKRRGKTILLTTHDMAEAERMADIVAFLRDGEIVRSGELGQFKGMIDRQAVDIFFVAPADADGERESLAGELDRMTGVRSVRFDTDRCTIEHDGTIDLNEALSRFIGRGFGVDRVTPDEPSLEEVFIELARE